MDFKKALIASTAICAVGAIAATTADAADKPKLKISGYVNTYMGFGDQNASQGTTGTPTFGGSGGTSARLISASMLILQANGLMVAKTRITQRIHPMPRRSPITPPV